MVKHVTAYSSVPAIPDRADHLWYTSAGEPLEMFHADVTDLRLPRCCHLVSTHASYKGSRIFNYFIKTDQQLKCGLYRIKMPLPKTIDYKNCVLVVFALPMLDNLNSLST